MYKSMHTYTYTYAHTYTYPTSPNTVTTDLEGLRVVAVAGELLFTLGDIHQAVGADETGQLGNDGHVFGNVARHFLERRISLDECLQNPNALVMTKGRSGRLVRALDLLHREPAHGYKDHIS